MSINLEKEKNFALSAADRYDIISFAIEAADDSGFLNSFVFERALYCYAALMLMEDNKIEIQAKLTGNLMDAWDYCVEEGIIDEMVAQYSEVINQLSSEASIWFEEYNTYVTSARGILSIVEQFSGDIVQSAASALSKTAEDTGVNNIIDIANE